MFDEVPINFVKFKFHLKVAMLSQLYAVVKDSEITRMKNTLAAMVVKPSHHYPNEARP